MKAVSNMVFLRGDGVYDNTEEIDQIFNLQDNSLARNSEIVSPSGSQIYRDSHRLFGHEKSAAILSNNQS